MILQNIFQFENLSKMLISCFYICRFHQKDGVIVLGATNKIENLDRALLRPGRFDVKIRVEYPDYIGRKDILTLYLSKILSGPLDMDILARRMIGCTGADIANIVSRTEFNYCTTL